MCDYSLLNDDESLDDLEFNNLFIIQKKKGFRFGMDPVLLCDFVNLKNNQKIADFGAGTGIISILLSQKAKNLKIHAIEIQKDLVNMLNRSIALNNLDSIEVHEADFTDLKKKFLGGYFDVIVSNPPYGKLNADIVNQDDSINISRREVGFNLEEYIKSVSYTLKYGGNFYLCFPCNRFMELIFLLKKYKLVPKRIRFIHAKPNSSPYLFMLMATKLGKDYVNFDCPLFVRKENGEYTDEILRIYHKKREA